MRTNIGIHVHENEQISCDEQMLYVEENRSPNVMCIEFVTNGGTITFFLHTREQARHFSAQLYELSDAVNIDAKKLEKFGDML